MPPQFNPNDRAARGNEGAEPGRRRASGTASPLGDDDLAALFAVGIGAFHRGQWAAADEALSALVQHRPDYERDGVRAITLLAEVGERRRSRAAPTRRRDFVVMALVTLGMASLLTALFLVLRGNQAPPVRQGSVAAQTSATRIAVPTVASAAAPTLSPIGHSTATPGAEGGGGAPSPAVSGKIVFSAGDPDRRHLYVIGANGDGMRQLTTGAGDDENPSCSPDGKQAVFQRMGNGQSRLYRVALDAPGGIQAIGEPPGDDQIPVWSPDGRSIAYARRGAGGVNGYVFRLSDGSAAPLTGSGSDWRMAYSPDGAQIVFTSTRTGRNGLWLMHADGSNARILTLGDSDDRDPAWSPNGKWIAFLSDRIDHQRSLYRLSVLDDSVTRLTVGPFDDQYPNWSPDSQRIVFASSRTGRLQLYTIAWDGGEISPLATSDLPAVSPAWCR